MLALFHEYTLFDLVGVDISNKMLKEARKRYTNAMFIRDDICTLDSGFLVNNSFHCILIGGVSIQMFDCSQRRRIFSNVKRLLRDDGVFIFNIMKSENSDERAFDTTEVRLSKMINEKQVIVLYHRIVLQPPILFKQYVHLIEHVRSEEPTLSTGEVDIYKITPEDFKGELGRFNLTLMPLPTQNKDTEFFIAEKGR